MAAVSPVGRASGLEPLELVAGSHAAAAALYERHSNRVFAYCLSRLGRREDAEDAAQTTFLHAVRGMRRGVVPSIEVAWLLGIARNVCLSRWESVGRRGRLELACDPVDLERSPAPQGRGDELIGLEDALGRLPEQQRRAVLLRDWRGLSYEEVATQMGVSLANAETLIFRGRRTLAELLQEEPATTRRRLASLGNLGSLFTTIKTAFTSAAAITKIAAAVTVVAASGVGVAAGTSHLDPGGDTPAAPMVSTPPASVAPTAPPARRAVVTPTPSAPARVARAQPSAAQPAMRETPSTAPAAAPPATPTADAPALAPSAPAGSVPSPAATVPRAAAAVPATSSTVQSTVAEALPEIPIATPPLLDPIGSLPVPQLPVETPPIVETVVGALPPVTVTLPPVLPIGPATLDPPALLP